MNKTISCIWVCMILAGFLAGFYWNMGKLFLQASWASEVATSLTAVTVAQGDNQTVSQEGKALPDYKILFVGDIMLDRNVEKLSQKYGSAYPFEKNSNFLAGYNIVSANLEGPIVETPIDTGAHSLVFSFPSESANLLASENVDLVSLANNHTLNMGQIGLSQTREYLKGRGIGFAGDPLKCGSDLLFEKDNFIFLSFNQTFSGCKNTEMEATVKDTRVKYPDKFLIVNMHWGVEYQSTNTAAQKKMAHALIDSGADLIIGHHPHVVENIELYKNKLIFYSLGNFIFDQYFNQKVQQGLAIELQTGRQEFIYKIYPLISQKSQPSVMEAKDAAKFLSDLASISSPDLSDSIKSGQIILNNN
ncbi:MAG: CapA family protein [Patescibacteria group bacterium]|nr:CapA family protein [Patescibacteria group bacterium]